MIFNVKRGSKSLEDFYAMLVEKEKKLDISKLKFGLKLENFHLKVNFHRTGGGSRFILDPTLINQIYPT